MGVDSFTFKGVASTSYLIVENMPPISKAKKDIEMIEVPGRDGFLTNDLGSYRGTVKPIECIIRDLDDLAYICSWLDGEGDLILSNEPTKVYTATIINQIDFAQVIKDLDCQRFLVQFECQPKKKATTNPVTTMTVSGSTITNPGTVNSKPAITVFGSGTISLNVAGVPIVLTNVSTSVTIDSYLLDCYKGTVLKNTDMSGEFPELIPGVNTITWSGTVSKIEIIPNWRWL